MYLLVFVQSFPPQPVLSDSFPSFLCQSSPNQLLYNIYLREKKMAEGEEKEGQGRAQPQLSRQGGTPTLTACESLLRSFLKIPVLGLLI